MRVVAMCMLLLGLAAPARAQSITSFEPDTTRHAPRGGTPPDMVDVPVWTGLEFALPTTVASELDGVTADLSMPWVGVTAAWPWKGPQQGWLGAGYQHWEYSAEVVGTGGHAGFDIDQFTLRSGVDQLFWAQNRLSVALGGGFGLGYGWTDSSPLFSWELLARAMLCFKASARTRISFGVQGTGAYVNCPDGPQGSFGHAELVLRLDNTMRLPKRIVPGLGP
jgi:hypothetical protein